MGIAYVVVGGICVLLGTLFAVAHLVRPRYGFFFHALFFRRTLMLYRKLGDHTYLTWNSEPQSTAVATGRDERFGSHAP